MSIKELRSKLLLTQEEFAKIMEVTTGTVITWETGKFKPRVKNLRKLKEICDQSGIDFSRIEF